MITNNTSKGTLYLIPSFLSESNDISFIPPYVISIIASLKHFITENPKTARAFLKKVLGKPDFNTLFFEVLDEHNANSNLSHLLQPLLAGLNVGLLSEAGCPSVADPGQTLVALAHHHGINVKPLIGGSSILLSLMASGLNGQSFCFHGYLPVERKERQRKIKLLESYANKFNQTQIFIETPYRNDAMLRDILEVCSDNTQLCIASDLTGANESIKTYSISEWKRRKTILGKIPCIFLIG